MAMMNPCRATRHHRHGFGHRGDQSAFNFLKVGAPGIAWLKIVERDARMTGQGERAPVHYHVVDARRRHFRFGLVVGGAAGFSPMRSRQLPVYLVPHRCRPANRALADRSSAVIRCRRVVPPRTPRSLATAESVGSGEASGLVIVTASFWLLSPEKGSPFPTATVPQIRQAWCGSARCCRPTLLSASSRAAYGRHVRLTLSYQSPTRHCS